MLPTEANRERVDDMLDLWAMAVQHMDNALLELDKFIMGQTGGGSLHYFATEMGEIRGAFRTDTYRSYRRMMRVANTYSTAALPPLFHYHANEAALHMLQCCEKD